MRVVIGDEMQLTGFAKASYSIVAYSLVIVTLKRDCLRRTVQSTSTVSVSNNVPLTWIDGSTVQPSGSPSGPISADPSLYANLRKGDGGGALPRGINANVVCRLGHVARVNLSINAVSIELLTLDSLSALPSSP